MTGTRGTLQAGMPAMPADVVIPSRDDPVVRRGSELVGGPMGRHADVGRGGAWWTPLRVLLVMVFVVSGFGLLQKEHCREKGFTAPGHFFHGCYSDIPPLYYGRGLADGEVPYIHQSEDRRVEYPVLTGAAMWVTAKLVPDSGDQSNRSRWYFDINALALAMCAAATVFATMKLAGRRPWDAAMVALAPGLLLAGTINWDLYAVALLGFGMLAWARRRPVAAGVLIGLATAAKFYPLFVLGPLFVLCWRAGKLREFRRAFAAAVVAWLVVNVPVMLIDISGWAKFYTLSRERLEGFSSIWFVLDQAGYGVPDKLLNPLAGGLFAVACLAIGVFALTAERRPRFPQLAFLTVAAFLLTNKVYSPQYVLWLIPLAALARPRWRDFLIWQATEVVHFFGIWMLLAGYPPGTPNRGLDKEAYGVTVFLHILGTLWLCAMIVRDIRNPQHDPVRANGLEDDPAGGVLDGVPDVFRLPWPPRRSDVADHVGVGGGEPDRAVELVPDRGRGDVVREEDQ
ncbi:MAG: glycosyltransferase 87 family protein [Sporichthyaceae bacterium]